MLLEFRSAAAILLAAALLFAQFSGFAHRIDHGPFAPAHDRSGQPADDHDSKLSHSCVAFDAAAIADAIHLPPCITPLLTSGSSLALWTAFASWDAPLVLHFSSRAPPFS